MTLFRGNVHCLSRLLLYAVLPSEKASLLHGDFEEIYRLERLKLGRLKAAQRYWKELMVSLLPIAGRQLRRRADMISNYLKVAIRQIRRERGYAFINISGLAVGLTACLFILLWVTRELTVDRFHPNYKNIHRLYLVNTMTDGTQDISPSLQLPAGPYLAERFPEIERYARLGHYAGSIRRGDVTVSPDGCHVDPQFLEMFHFPLEQGQVQNALSDPNSIVISEELAGQLFGDEDPMGQMLTVDGGDVLRVTGVMQPMAGRSHFNFDYLLPVSRLTQYLDDWGNFRFWIYLELKPGTDVAAFNEKIGQAIQEVAEDERLVLHTQTLTDVYLRDLQGGGVIQTLRILSGIAVLVLMIACINFMNLATARSLKRAREIGLRKTVGARPVELMRQFLGESLVYALLAFLVAQLFVVLLLPYFNQLTGQQMSYSIFMSSGIVPAGLGIAVLTGLLSGLYPAMVLSRFQIVKVLKSAARTGSGGSAARVRKVLVVLQFSLSIALIFMVNIMDRQLGFIKTLDLGVKPENVICIPARMPNWTEKTALLKSEMKQDPNVTAVTTTFMPPVYRAITTTGAEWEGMTEGEMLQMDLFPADGDYLDVLGLKLVQGRFFSREGQAVDRNHFVINESAAEAMGMEDPVGRSLTWNEKAGTIIGVVKDFHFRPLQHRISPALFTTIDWKYFIMVKTSGKDAEATLAHIREAYLRVFPGADFDYSYFEDRLARAYRSEHQVHQLIRLASIMAIFISCLGLLGLAAFTAEQRRKEVSIRRVLGAGFARIFLMMTGAFTRWVLLANVIAWPLAYWLAGRWLSVYAYRISIGWENFIISGGVALAVAALTVGHISLQSARSNPAAVLRSE